jgi:hypothetical protein
MFFGFVHRFDLLGGLFQFFGFFADIFGGSVRSSARQTF